MIKTFTLRLTDVQAEALDRLAFVYGASKNQIINALIAREYQCFLYGRLNEGTTPVNEEIIDISQESDFPTEYICDHGTSEDDGETVTYNATEIKQIIKCYDYAIEHSDDEKEINRLEDARREWVFKLKNS